MKLSIQKRHGELSARMKQMVERRLLFALARFQPTLQRISVVLSDLNGPKGGIDQACRVTAFLMHGDVLTITDQDAKIELAVGRCAERLSRAVTRQLERMREGRKSKLDRHLSAEQQLMASLSPEDT